MHFFFNNSDLQDVQRTAARQQVAAGGGFFFQGGPIPQVPLHFGVQQQFAPVPAAGQQTGGQSPSVQTAGGTSSAIAFPLPPPIALTPPPTGQPPADVTATAVSTSGCCSTWICTSNNTTRANAKPQCKV